MYSYSALGCNFHPHRTFALCCAVRSTTPFCTYKHIYMYIRYGLQMYLTFVFQTPCPQNATILHTTDSAPLRRLLNPRAHVHTSAKRRVSTHQRRRKNRECTARICQRTLCARVLCSSRESFEFKSILLAAAAAAAGIAIACENRDRVWSLS